MVEIVREARARDARLHRRRAGRSRAHAVPICARCAAAGFALRGVDLEPLRRRPVVRDLAALARALLHRCDRTAWLALLRAPWCGPAARCSGAAGQPQRGFTVGCNQPGRSRWRAPGSERARARACARCARRWRVRERFEPLWNRCERSWLRLGGPAVASNARDLDDARAFLRALAAAGDAEELAGDALQRLADGLYAQSGLEPGAIEVLTLHAAKGLEWDVVIVPALGRVTARDSEPLLHWLELARPDAGSDLLLAPISGLKEVPHALSDYIRWLRRERLRIERVRQLYVAATRARLQLHWLAHAPLGSDGTPTPRGGSLLALLWPAIGGQFTALDGFE